MNRDEFLQPFSQEAEQSVLGALLIDNAGLDRIADLEVGHFYTSVNRTIFSEIAAQIVSGKECDVLTVHDALQAKGVEVGGLAYINSLQANTPSSAGIARYAEIIRNKALERALVGFASEIMEQSTKSVTERLEDAQSKLAKLAERKTIREPLPLMDVLSAHLGTMENRLSKRQRAISTGLDDMDKQLNGGIRPGNLVIVGARPSMGKTALAVTLAQNMAHDYSVGLLSMEMSNEEVSDRLIAGLGRIPLDRIQQAEESDTQLWDSITPAFAKAESLHFCIDDDAGLTLLDVRNKARYMKRKHGLDVLIVDYLQLMRGRDESQNRNSQLEEISRGLKQLAKELKIAVIALVQLNRKAEERGDAMPMMSDIRDCGAIEQDADVIMFLHRPEQAKPDLGAEFKGFAKLRIAKNRQGQCGDLALTYLGQYTLFGGWAGRWPSSDVVKRRGNFHD